MSDAKPPLPLGEDGADLFLAITDIWLALDALIAVIKKLTF